MSSNLSFPQKWKSISSGWPFGHSQPLLTLFVKRFLTTGLKTSCDLGDCNGSYAVLEVKTNELPFMLEDGQTIARIKYEKLNKKTSVVYGSSINSNYQNQKLALSKHFK